MTEKQWQTEFKVRLSSADVHYADSLVSGAKVLEFFGDAATELLIQKDGDEGYFRAYENVEFLHPVRAGDFLQISAKIVNVGKTSRKMEFSAHKIIEANPTDQNPHAAKVVAPILCVKAVGTCVVKK